MKTGAIIVAAAAIAFIGCGGSSGGTTSGGSSGSGGTSGSSGGNCQLQGTYTTCTVGCNGMTAIQLNGGCAVTPPVGATCYSDPLTSGQTSCCNSEGGFSNFGTVVSGHCPGDANDLCAADSECNLGETCVASFSGPLQCGSQQNANCTTAGFPPLVYACCTGLSATDGGNCGFPAGATCNRNEDCASGTCVPAATTASCQ